MLVVSLSIWVLVDGASHDWRIPDGRYGWLFPGAVLGSAFGLVISAALVLNFALAQGVAIAKVNDEFVLYFPFSRKRVPVSGAAISATSYEAAVPAFGSMGLFKAPPVVAAQVTIQRPGWPDLNFRTGLLRERANVIAERMSALAK
ncbi:MAG: hypothetical protein P4M09_16445 [Devosia sp.]|nr:hypothetical protein [Devosia sp.]